MKKLRLKRWVKELMVDVLAVIVLVGCVNVLSAQSDSAMASCETSHSHNWCVANIK